MINVILHGCCGEMGHAVTDLIDQENDMKIIAGIDPAYGKTAGNYGKYPIFRDISELNWHNLDKKADVVIDFSDASVVDRLFDFCLETQTPLVLCASGLSSKQLLRIDEVAKEVPVFRSFNMSLGVNLLMSLVKQAAGVLADAGFDIEIVEKHHNQKADAPSDTALALADAMNETMGNIYEYKYDRNAVYKKRDEKEIGISSVRGGTIVGDHDVIFAGEDEVITISHRAYSHAIFAKGAIQAAKFIAELDNDVVGIYTIANMFYER